MARMDRESVDRARGMRSEMTRAEVILWTRLRRRQVMGFHFVRQKQIGPYFADFACAAAMLVVEVDGATHSTAEELSYDAARTAFMERAGWSVVRFWNDEVYRNEDGVVETVMGYLEGLRRPLGDRAPSGPSGHLPRLRRGRTSCEISDLKKLRNTVQS